MIWQDRPSTRQRELDPEEELERRLIARAHAGAEWALSALVARYQPPVVRYLVRLTGSQQMAYALAEQVFVRMGTRLRGPHGGDQLRLWLLRTATDVGLDAIRAPTRAKRERLLPNAGPAGLLTSRSPDSRRTRVLSSLRGKVSTRPTESKPPDRPEFVWQAQPQDQAAGASADREPASITPEQVRRRLLRAVLAELPYDEAQCLALHLVAGLNQSDVAQALGISDVVERRRVVHGLEFFGARYASTLERLGLREEPDTSDDAVTLRDAVPDVVPDVAAASVVDAPPVTMPEEIPVVAAGEEAAAHAGEPAAVATPATVVEAAAVLAADFAASPTEGAESPEAEREMLAAHLMRAPVTQPLLLPGPLAPDGVEAEEIESQPVTRLAAITRPLTRPLDYFEPAEPPIPERAPAATRPVSTVEEAVVSATAEVWETDDASDHQVEALTIHDEPPAQEPIAAGHAPAPLLVLPAPATQPLTAEAVERAALAPAARLLTRRLRHVLSADGEAEDPGDEALWPLR